MFFSFQKTYKIFIVLVGQPKNLKSTEANVPSQNLKPN